MDFDLLKSLVSVPGISGREERVRAYVSGVLSELVDETQVDAMGNIVGIRRGSGPRVMLSAHMDTIGFLVSHIDDEGFLRIMPVGGFDPRTLVNQRVLVQGRQDYVGLVTPTAKPVHLSTKEEREKAAKMEELFVDVMLPVDEVRANICVGDPVSLHREAHVTDRGISAPYLDDRLGVYVLLMALREARNTQAEISAVVTVQEEVGLRGAVTGAYGSDPQIGVALDVTIAGDIPGTDKATQVAVFDGGAAISLMDGASISDPRLVAKFRSLAEQHGIKHQLEMMPRGGTDAGAIQSTRAGVPVITVGIPTRYLHTANESALASDIDACVSLVARFLETAHEVSLSW